MKKKKVEKLYYYFCRKCKRAIGRNTKRLRFKSFCDEAGDYATMTLITKTKI